MKSPPIPAHQRQTHLLSANVQQYSPRESLVYIRMILIHVMHMDRVYGYRAGIVVLVIAIIFFSALLTAFQAVNDNFQTVDSAPGRSSVLLIAVISTASFNGEIGLLPLGGGNAMVRFSNGTTVNVTESGLVIPIHLEASSWSGSGELIVSSANISFSLSPRSPVAIVTASNLTNTYWNGLDPATGSGTPQGYSLFYLTIFGHVSISVIGVSEVR